MGFYKEAGLTPDMLKVYERLPEMYLILASDLNVITASEAYLQNTGTKRSNIVGKNIFQVCAVDQNSGIADSLAYVQRNKSAHQIPVSKLKLAGFEQHEAQEQRYWKTSHTPMLNADGEIDYIIQLTLDVTDFFKVDAAVASDRIDTNNLNKVFAEATNQIEATNEELTATNHELFLPEQELREVNANLEQRFAARTYEMELAKAEAERQRKRLESFFMQAPAGICILDGPEFIFELVNATYQQLFNGRALLGKRLLDALPEVKNEETINIIKEVYATGNTFEGNGLLVPLAKNGGGPIENRFFNFIYQARLNADREIDGILAFVFEVTDMVIAEQKLEKNEKHLEILLNALPQQVWTAKPDGALNYVNEVVCTDFGEPAEAIIGHGWQKFIHPDDLGGCLQAWEEALDTRKDYLVEFRLLLSTGIYAWYLGRAIPLIEDGRVKLWMGTNTDIDLQKNNEQKKDEFISIASHELKTPLTSIKAFNQLLQRTTEIEKMGGFLAKSHQNIKRLERLIDDLLDVTKINAGKITYSIKDFNFGEMLSESIEGIQFLSQLHEIVLADNVDVTYTGDRFRIEQVLTNFLTNAVKYSPRGGKVIVKSQIELNSIVVSVQDFGIGIAEQDLNKLFDRYYRVDNSSMRFEGLGLGLFISSEILKRHHGSFWLESNPGQGSTFYFRLPLSVVNILNPVVKRADFYRDQFITISYSRPANRLDVDWTGYQSLESVKNGCALMLEMLKLNNCSKVVNDNSNVLGTWSEASDWLREEWFPAMSVAGLDHFAWVYGPHVFSQLSAQKSFAINTGNVVNKFFTSLKLAQKWIDQN